MSKAGPNDWLSSKDVDIDGADSPGSSIKMLKVDTTVTLGELSIIDPLGTQAIADSVAVTPATASVFNTISGQVGVAGGAGAVTALTQRVVQAGITVTDYSIADMSGASQTVIIAGNGRGIMFFQAPAANSGIVWLNLAGGTAVVGTGLPLAAGASVTIQPGFENAVKGIAATAHDVLTVYAG